jgi:hypothetical protein
MNIARGINATKVEIYCMCYVHWITSEDGMCKCVNYLFLSGSASFRQQAKIWENPDFYSFEFCNFLITYYL